MDVRARDLKLEIESRQTAFPTLHAKHYASRHYCLVSFTALQSERFEAIE